MDATEKEVAATLLSMRDAPAATAAAPRTPERIIAQDDHDITPPLQHRTTTGRKRVRRLDLEGKEPCSPNVRDPHCKVQTQLIHRLPARLMTFTTVHCLWRDNTKIQILGPDDCSRLWRCIGIVHPTKGGILYIPFVVNVRNEADDTRKHLRLIHIQSTTSWYLTFSKKWHQIEKHKNNPTYLSTLLDTALVKLMPTPTPM
jgi:hypothetical protein